MKLEVLEKLQVRHSANSSNDIFETQVQPITNFLAKKQRLFEICYLLLNTQYWSYTPLQVLVSWTLGAILEDEWSWTNLSQKIPENKFKGFFSKNQTKDKKFFTKNDGLIIQLQEEEFNRQYEPVYIYTDVTKSYLQESIDSLPQGYKINYVTKNCEKWLGWEQRELISQSVNKLIPLPFKSYHDEYMSSKRLNGSVLMAKSVRQIFCETKNSGIEPVYFGLRLSYSIDQGIQFIAMIYFEKIKKQYRRQKLMISIDHDGNIIQSNPLIKQYIHKNLKIIEQVPKIEEILQEFDYINSLKTTKDKLEQILDSSSKQEKTNEIIDVPYQIMQSLQTYLLYSPDFKRYELQKNKVSPLREKLQKKAQILLTNIKTAEKVLFELNVYYFVQKNKIEGRLLIFDRSKEDFENVELRPMEFSLTKNKKDKTNRWRNWEDQVYSDMKLEELRQPRMIEDGRVYFINNSYFKIKEVKTANQRNKQDTEV